MTNSSNCRNMSRPVVRRVSLIIALFGFCLSIVTGLCLIMSLLAPDPELTPYIVSEEQYSVDTAKLDTVSELTARIELDVREQGLDGIEVPILIDEYVRNKFYQEYSTIPWYDNWVLAVTDLVIPQYLLPGNMKPDDIVRYDYGICNQQAILFQELVKEFGYDYGSVRFQSPDFGHFASAVRVNGDWYFFDPNLEPEYDRTNPDIFRQIDLGNKQVLTRIYGDHFENITEDMIILSGINTFPASRGVLAQELTFILSWYGWMLILLPSAATMFRQGRLQRRCRGSSSSF